MRPSTPMSAIASCAPCTAAVSSSTQPEFGSLTKRPVAAGEPFEIGLGKFQTFLLPFGGNGQPVNAAALDDELRLELARREEQPVKRRVAEKFRFRRTRPPTRRRASRENFHSHRRSTSRVPA